MLKYFVVLLVFVHFSKTEDTINEIIFHLRDLRDQQHLLTFVSRPSNFYIVIILWIWIECKKERNKPIGVLMKLGF